MRCRLESGWITGLSPESVESGRKVERLRFRPGGGDWVEEVVDLKQCVFAGKEKKTKTRRSELALTVGAGERGKEAV